MLRVRAGDRCRSGSGATRVAADARADTSGHRATPSRAGAGAQVMSSSLRPGDHVHADGAGTARPGTGCVLKENADGRQGLHGHLEPGRIRHHDHHPDPGRVGISTAPFDIACVRVGIHTAGTAPTFPSNTSLLCQLSRTTGAIGGRSSIASTKVAPHNTTDVASNIGYLYDASAAAITGLTQESRSGRVSCRSLPARRSPSG